ncbi:MAG: hypothetical protein IKM46_05010 [Clostridia bacterium]|nr:hypothetical protein [Clostridia bacterium]
MRNIKMLIALLLSLVMIFTLAACSSVEDDKDDKKDKEEKTEQTDDNDEDDKENDEDTKDDEDDKKDEEDTKDEDEDTKKETDPEEDEPSDSDDPADLIVGKWRAKIDVTEAMELAIAVSGFDDVGALDYFEFDKMYYIVDMNFKKNGDLNITMDIGDMIDVLIEGLENGLEEYADANGIDVDDLYAALDTDADNFGEKFVELCGFENLSYDVESEYEIVDDEIVVEGDGLAFEFEDEDTLLLDAEGLGLTGMVEDDMIAFDRK